jgi:hypothetical protein
MPQDIETTLANAKKVLGEAEQKFPSPSMPQPQKPTYSAAREARKAPSIGDELKAKGDMVQKAKQALNQ